MSGYYHAPYEIQVEIIKRVVPVKSLIRLRSVSKQWKSLVDSFEFTSADHSVKPRHLMVMNRNRVDSMEEFVSIADDDDDDRFPHHKFSPFVPPTVKLVRNPLMLDSSQGLVCLYGSHRYLDNEYLFVLWNPSIRKSIGLLLPTQTVVGFSGRLFPSPIVVGFGVCPKTNDPKIARISSYSAIDWQAEVFTLSSGAWRSVPMPCKVSDFKLNQLVIDGVIHWLVLKPGNECLIVSFDLITEEFRQVPLPEECLSNIKCLSVSKLNDSLVVARCFDVVDARMCDVWVMNKHGDGSSDLYTKLFTFSIALSDIGSMASQVIGFRKNGEPITEHMFVDDRKRVSSTLKVYDPSSKSINDLGIGRSYDALFKMSSYSESLLLLNYPNSMIQS